ncbi:MAG: response regulator [Deltaproteobacteria bacterium]|nr:response regulator [Deltaproteobacteria bacterium]
MLTSKKILIVEDCGELLNLLGEALALLGWETILAESGPEAMNKLELEYDLPSVVLLDMRTPVIGIKLAASLKAHPVYNNIPILAVSGQFRGLNRERCRAPGCDDCIPRPFEIPELETRLTKILAAERLKTIRATGPLNLDSNPRERRSRGAGRRRVA